MLATCFRNFTAQFKSEYCWTDQDHSHNATVIDNMNISTNVTKQYRISNIIVAYFRPLSKFDTHAYKLITTRQMNNNVTELHKTNCTRQPLADV